MVFIDESEQQRKRDCLKLRKTFHELLEETRKLKEVRIPEQQNAVRAAEIDLESFDDEMERQFIRDFSFMSPPRFKGREPDTRMDKQLEALKDAVEGIEVVCRLGDDVFRAPLKDLDGRPLAISIRNPPTRQHLLERLENAREELERLQAELERKEPALEDAQARFSARRCLDFFSAAEVIVLPPPRRP